MIERITDFTQHGWVPKHQKVQGFFLSLALVFSLQGCGGSGGDDSTVDPSGEQNQGSLVFPEISSENLRVIPSSEMFAFNSDSPFAGVLKTCALADEDSLCTLATLPYIGSNTNNPDIEDIMDRVLVTHNWMGVRFRQLLNAMPDDMLGMFRPVTSVMIGSEVRPSSMSSYRGLMRLDPDYLWSSEAEKSTISEAEDFRTNFGADLLFVGRWRVMNGDEYAFKYSERDLNSIEGPLAMLLYHELAHANDRIRPERIATLSSSQTPKDAVLNSLDTDVLALQLDSDESLSVQSSILFGLARVRYRNDQPSDLQKSVDADIVGSVMASEGKTQFYGYYTVFEDVATLFAATMMKFHYNYDLHTAFINKPANYPEQYTCDELIVSWGSRNRIAAPLVAPRAKWVAEKIVGSSAALDSFFANRLGQEIPLRMGDNWCDSRFLNPAVAAATRTRSDSTDAEILQNDAKYFRHH